LGGFIDDRVFDQMPVWPVEIFMQLLNCMTVQQDSSLGLSLIVITKSDEKPQT
jgi:hypothetical protein